MAGTTIATFTGPQDPSQLDNLLNQVINAINGYVTGSTPIVGVVSVGSTTGNLPTSGTVILNSTTRTAGTTGRYAIANPTAAQVGQVVNLFCASTVKAIVTGTFDKAKTKLTFASTTAAKNRPAGTLSAVSTSQWALISVAGPLTST
jgi:hypothetical protein